MYFEEIGVHAHHVLFILGSNNQHSFFSFIFLQFCLGRGKEEKGEDLYDHLRGIKIFQPMNGES
jgi:hypothetical protein